MAKERLHNADIRTVVQKVSCEGMSQGVTRNML
jgi:hypothetical protein